MMETECLFFLFCFLQSTLTVSAETGCPIEFEEACECGRVHYGPEQKLTYVTNCTDAGFDNTMMLRMLPHETEVLIFVGNDVKDLPLNIFGQDVAYDKLHTIDFSNNHIQSIKGRTFHNVANVTKLILDDNDLYIVSKDHHPRMFSNFKNLKELHLRNAFTEKLKADDYLRNLVEIFENSTLHNLRVLNMEDNEISYLSKDAFCSLPLLQELFLGNNYLRDMPLNLSCMKYLRFLDLGDNLIRYLEEPTLKILDGKKYLALNITDNPFTCDCNMAKTYIWMVTTPVTLLNRERFICYDGFPPNVGKRLISVQLEELKCEAAAGNMTSSATISVTVGLVCTLLVLSLFIYRNREACRRALRRMFYPIESKIHYVSLERRATMEV